MLIRKEIAIRLINKIIELKLLKYGDIGIIKNANVCRDNVIDDIFLDDTNKIKLFLKPVNIEILKDNLDVIVLIKKKNTLYHITIKYLDQVTRLPEYKETMHNIEQVIDKLNKLYNVNIDLDYILNIDEELIECNIPYKEISDFVKVINRSEQHYTRDEVIENFKSFFKSN